MYSIVLMMAITTGGHAPAGGDGGCCGCAGSSVQSCGCCGGLFARLLDRFHGCSGGHLSSYGCSGAVATGCNGCTGGTPSSTETAPATQAPPNAAKIIVRLPETAALLIDGRVTSAVSAERTFTTPSLDEGAENIYTLKAAMVENGDVVVQTMTVTVHAGQETHVTMDCLIPLKPKETTILPVSAVSAK